MDQLVRDHLLHTIPFRASIHCHQRMLLLRPCPLLFAGGGGASGNSVAAICGRLRERQCSVAGNCQADGVGVQHDQAPILHATNREFGRQKNVHLVERIFGLKKIQWVKWGGHNKNDAKTFKWHKK